MSDQKQIEDPSTALLTAAKNSDLEAVKALLDTGVDANVADPLGTTPLHIAAEQGDWDIARLLLERKASPWNKDGNDVIPLHLAVQEGHLEVARLLIETDRSTRNCATQSGYSPLQLAAVRDIAMVRLILDGDGSVYTASSNRLSQNALHQAAQGGHHDICELLLEHDRYQKFTFMERLFGLKSPVYCKDIHRDTPLVCAVNGGHTKTVEIFLRSKLVSPNARNGYKEVLFHKPVLSKDCEMVKVFLDYGVNVNIKGKLKRTALHLAAMNGDVEMVQLLLRYGASTRAKDHVNWTPVEVSRDAEVTVILRNHAAAGGGKGKERAIATERPAVAAPPPEYSAQLL